MTTTSLEPTDIGTIYCVGRNYAAHAKELNNPIPKEPVIFVKARSTACHMPCEAGGVIDLPLSLNRCDHETEIVIRLGADLTHASPEQALAAISHYGMALDLTLREKQTELKQQSYPWDLAKSFVNACPMSSLIPFDSLLPLDDIEFELTINGETRQKGNSANMLFGIVDLIVFISQNIPLMAGDLVLTGTPEGVGPLNDQDQLQLSLNGQLVAQAVIVRKTGKETISK